MIHFLHFQNRYVRRGCVDSICLRYLVRSEDAERMADTFGSSLSSYGRVNGDLATIPLGLELPAVATSSSHEVRGRHEVTLVAHWGGIEEGSGDDHATDN